MSACYCGGHYRCEKCRHDVCYCTCEVDGAPYEQSAVTSGYINPSQARIEAWTQKRELTR